MINLCGCTLFSVPLLCVRRVYLCATICLRRVYCCVEVWCGIELSVGSLSSGLGRVHGGGSVPCVCVVFAVVVPHLCVSLGLCRDVFVGRVFFLFVHHELCVCCVCVCGAGGGGTVSKYWRIRPNGLKPQHYDY